MGARVSGTGYVKIMVKPRDLLARVGAFQANPGCQPIQALLNPSKWPGQGQGSSQQCWPVLQEASLSALGSKYRWEERGRPGTKAWKARLCTKETRRSRVFPLEA